MESAIGNQGFEVVDDVYVAGPGRPMTSRTAELYTKMSKWANSDIETRSMTLKVDLDEDETGKSASGKDNFYRFTQRCRTAARKLGIKVRVSKSRNEPAGYVMMLED